jgi:pSer/pThr/pTyr-binding forkhead associated (FHA) protein
MSFAKLIVIQPGYSAREFEIVGDLLTIGRALDNTISLEGDTNVSRYHAEITKRGNSFWVTDLGSSNGTTVNDQPISFECELQNGDLISTGGTTIIEFHLSETPWRRRKQPRVEPVVTDVQSRPFLTTPAHSPDAVAEETLPTPTQPSSRPQLGLILAGVGGGLLLTSLVAVFLYFKLAPKCNPTARIVSPQNGSRIREPIPIRVEVTDPKCIDRLIYELNGQEIASAEVSPYEIILNPQLLPDLPNGSHVLSVTVKDNEGKKTAQPETVLLAFGQNAKDSRVESAENPSSSNETASALVSNSDVKSMVTKLAQHINPKSDYVFDPDFLDQVRARTGRYVNSGFGDRAAAFRDVINDQFVNEQGLPAALAYVLAMSRSRFAIGKNSSAGSAPGGADAPQGLWQIQPSIAQDYIGRCEASETLADPNQKCSSIVSSYYTKRLVVGIFKGDFVYAVSTFGMSPAEAAQFRDRLSSERRDFWKVIKSGPQRDRVVNFFAAGIVGENPKEFNLPQDKPLTNLY